jgi:hypothetical protein
MSSDPDQSGAVFDGNARRPATHLMDPILHGSVEADVAVRPRAAKVARRHAAIVLRATADGGAAMSQVRCNASRAAPSVPRQRPLIASTPCVTCTQL